MQPDEQAPVQPEAPVEQAPEPQAPEAAPTETVPENAVEPQVVEDTPQVQEESSPASEVEEDYTSYQPAPLDINQLPRDPENPEYVDNNALLAALSAQAREQARAEFAEQRREEKLWQDAEKAHPELADNKELRELVHNSRLGSLQAQLASGVQAPKIQTPKQIADKIFGQISSAKKEGYTQAQTNVEVQEGAHLETSNVTSQSTADSTPVGLVDKLGSTQSGQEKKQYVDQILKGMFDRGDLSIGG